MALRAGNRKVAGYLVKKAIEKDGFGFNFLHKEVGFIRKYIVLFINAF